MQTNNEVVVLRMPNILQMVINSYNIDRKSLALKVFLEHIIDAAKLFMYDVNNLSGMPAIPKLNIYMEHNSHIRLCGDLIYYFLEKLSEMNVINKNIYIIDIGPDTMYINSYEMDLSKPDPLLRVKNKDIIHDVLSDMENDNETIMNPINDNSSIMHDIMDYMSTLDSKPSSSLDDM